MENGFKSLTNFEFQERFPDDDCFEYLLEMKWGNFPECHRTIMGFNGWLRDMHYQVEHLQFYIEECCYRFNQGFMKDGIFENLLLRIVNGQPITYKQFIH